MRAYSMNINKEKFYLCRVKQDGTYEAPIPIKATFMPTNLEGDILAYGSEYTEYARTQEAITPTLDTIKVDDKVYYKKDLPAVHDVEQTSKSSANFIVSGKPTKTKNTIDIRYKRIPNR